MAEYFGKIWQLTDEMATTGKPLDEEDIISYILTGLDAEYNSIITAMAMSVEPVSVREVCTQL